MPVNQSDIVFFDKAQKIMVEAMQHAATPPTIHDIRATVPHFKVFLPEEPLLPYSTISIPSSTSNHTITARFISKGNAYKPLVVFFPGTGFMHHMFDEGYSVLSRIIKHVDAHGLLLEYRLSPENPFPSPHEDAKSMLNYLLANLDHLKVNKDKIIFSGHSSGANMAAVLCNSLQRHPNFKPFHQYLISGGFDYTDSLHDFDSYVNEDKMLDKEAQRMSFDLYCQDTNRKDPSCSPYWQEEFNNLCPTTIQCGEYDGGRSQSEGYAEKLKNHNVDLEKIITPGQTHFTIVYRGACSDGEDPAIVAAKRISSILV